MACEKNISYRTVRVDAEIQFRLASILAGSGNVDKQDDGSVSCDQQSVLLQSDGVVDSSACQCMQECQSQINKSIGADGSIACGETDTLEDQQSKRHTHSGSQLSIMFPKLRTSPSPYSHNLRGKRGKRKKISAAKTDRWSPTRTYPSQDVVDSGSAMSCMDKVVVVDLGEPSDVQCNNPIIGKTTDRKRGKRSRSAISRTNVEVASMADTSNSALTEAQRQWLPTFKGKGLRADNFRKPQRGRTRSNSCSEMASDSDRNTDKDLHNLRRSPRLKPFSSQLHIDTSVDPKILPSVIIQDKHSDNNRNTKKQVKSGCRVTEDNVTDPANTKRAVSIKTISCPLFSESEASDEDPPDSKPGPAFICRLCDKEMLSRFCLHEHLVQFHKVKYVSQAVLPIACASKVSGQDSPDRLVSVRDSKRATNTENDNALVSPVGRDRKVCMERAVHFKRTNTQLKEYSPVDRKQKNTGGLIKTDTCSEQQLEDCVAVPVPLCENPTQQSGKRTDTENDEDEGELDLVDCAESSPTNNELRQAFNVSANSWKPNVDPVQGLPECILKGRRRKSSTGISIKDVNGENFKSSADSGEQSVSQIQSDKQKLLNRNHSCLDITAENSVRSKNALSVTCASDRQSKKQSTDKYQSTRCVLDKQSFRSTIRDERGAKESKLDSQFEGEAVEPCHTLKAHDSSVMSDMASGQERFALAAVNVDSVPARRDVETNIGSGVCNVIQDNAVAEGGSGTCTSSSSDSVLKESSPVDGEMSVTDTMDIIPVSDDLKRVLKERDGLGKEVMPNGDSKELSHERCDDLYRTSMEDTKHITDSLNHGAVSTTLREGDFNNSDCLYSMPTSPFNVEEHPSGPKKSCLERRKRLLVESESDKNEELLEDNRVKKEKMTLLMQQVNHRRVVKQRRTLFQKSSCSLVTSSTEMFERSEKLASDTVQVVSTDLTTDSSGSDPSSKGSSISKSPKSNFMVEMLKSVGLYNRKPVVLLEKVNCELTDIFKVSDTTGQIETVIEKCGQVMADSETEADSDNRIIDVLEMSQIPADKVTMEGDPADTVAIDDPGDTVTAEGDPTGIVTVGGDPVVIIPCTVQDSTTTATLVDTGTKQERTKQVTSNEEDLSDDELDGDSVVLDHDSLTQDEDHEETEAHAITDGVSEGTASCDQNAVDYANIQESDVTCGYGITIQSARLQNENQGQGKNISKDMPIDLENISAVRQTTKTSVVSTELFLNSLDDLTNPRPVGFALGLPHVTTTKVRGKMTNIVKPTRKHSSASEKMENLLPEVYLDLDLKENQFDMRSSLSLSPVENMNKLSTSIHTCAYGKHLQKFNDVVELELLKLMDICGSGLKDMGYIKDMMPKQIVAVKPLMKDQATCCTSGGIKTPNEEILEGNQRETEGQKQNEKQCLSNDQDFFISKSQSCFQVLSCESPFKQNVIVEPAYPDLEFRVIDYSQHPIEESGQIPSMTLHGQMKTQEESPDGDDKIHDSKISSHDESSRILKGSLGQAELITEQVVEESLSQSLQGTCLMLPAQKAFEHLSPNTGPSLLPQTNGQVQLHQISLGPVPQPSEMPHCPRPEPSTSEELQLTLTSLRPEPQASDERQLQEASPKPKVREKKELKITDESQSLRTFEKLHSHILPTVQSSTVEVQQGNTASILDADLPLTSPTMVSCQVEIGSTPVEDMTVNSLLFVCEMCGKKFRQKGSLRKHWTNKGHSNTNLEPVAKYCCPFCCKVHFSSFGYKKHMNTCSLRPKQESSASCDVEQTSETSDEHAVDVIGVTEKCNHCLPDKVCVNCDHRSALKLKFRFRTKSIDHKAQPETGDTLGRKECEEPDAQVPQSASPVIKDVTNAGSEMCLDSYTPVECLPGHGEVSYEEAGNTALSTSSSSDNGACGPEDRHTETDLEYTTISRSGAMQSDNQSEKTMNVKLTCELCLQKFKPMEMVKHRPTCRGPVVSSPSHSKVQPKLSMTSLHEEHGKNMALKGESNSKLSVDSRNRKKSDAKQVLHNSKTTSGKEYVDSHVLHTQCHIDNQRSLDGQHSDITFEDCEELPVDNEETMHCDPPAALDTTADMSIKNKLSCSSYDFNSIHQEMTLKKTKEISETFREVSESESSDIRVVLPRTLAECEKLHVNPVVKVKRFSLQKDVVLNGYSLQCRGSYWKVHDVHSTSHLHETDNTGDGLTRSVNQHLSGPDKCQEESTRKQYLPECSSERPTRKSHESNMKEKTSWKKTHRITEETVPLTDFEKALLTAKKAEKVKSKKSVGSKRPCLQRRHSADSNDSTQDNRKLLFPSHKQTPANVVEQTKNAVKSKLVKKILKEKEEKEKGQNPDFLLSFSNSSLPTFGAVNTGDVGDHAEGPADKGSVNKDAFSVPSKTSSEDTLHLSLPLLPQSSHLAASPTSTTTDTAGGFKKLLDDLAVLFPKTMRGTKSFSKDALLKDLMSPPSRSAQQLNISKDTFPGTSRKPDTKADTDTESECHSSKIITSPIKDVAQQANFCSGTPIQNPQMPVQSPGLTPIKKMKDFANPSTSLFDISEESAIHCPVTQLLTVNTTRSSSASGLHTGIGLNKTQQLGDVTGTSMEIRSAECSIDFTVSSVSGSLSGSKFQQAEWWSLLKTGTDHIQKRNKPGTLKNQNSSLKMQCTRQCIDREDESAVDQELPQSSGSQDINIDLERDITSLADESKARIPHSSESQFSADEHADSCSSCSDSSVKSACNSDKLSYRCSSPPKKNCSNRSPWSSYNSNINSDNDEVEKETFDNEDRCYEEEKVDSEDDVLSLCAPSDASFLDEEDLVVECASIECMGDMEVNGRQPVCQDTEDKINTGSQEDFQTTGSDMELDSQSLLSGHIQVEERPPIVHPQFPRDMIPDGFCYSQLSSGNMCTNSSCRFRHDLPTREQFVCHGVMKIQHLCEKGQLSRAMGIFVRLQSDVPNRLLIQMLHCSGQEANVAVGYKLLQVMFERGIVTNTDINWFIYMCGHNTEMCRERLWEVFQALRNINLQPDPDAIIFLMRTFMECKEWNWLWNVMFYCMELDTFIVPYPIQCKALSAMVQEPGKYFTHAVQWLQNSRVENLQHIKKEVLLDVCTVCRRMKEGDMAESIVKVAVQENRSSSPVIETTNSEDGWQEPDPHILTAVDNEMKKFWLNRIQGVFFSKNWSYLGDTFVDLGCPIHPDLVDKFIEVLSKDQKSCDTMAVTFVEFLKHIAVNFKKAKNQNLLAVKDDQALTKIGNSMLKMCFHNQEFQAGQKIRLGLQQLGIDHVRLRSPEDADVILPALNICLHFGEFEEAMSIVKGASISALTNNQQHDWFIQVVHMFHELLQKRLLNHCSKLLSQLLSQFHQVRQTNLNPSLIIANCYERLLEQCLLTCDIYVAVVAFRHYNSYSNNMMCQQPQVWRAFLTACVSAGYYEEAAAVYEACKKFSIYYQQNIQSQMVVIPVWMTPVETMLVFQDYLQCACNSLCSRRLEGEVLTYDHLALKVHIDGVHPSPPPLLPFLSEVPFTPLAASSMVLGVLTTKLSPRLEAYISQVDGTVVVVPGSLEKYLQALDRQGTRQGLQFNQTGRRGLGRRGPSRFQKGRLPNSGVRGRLGYRGRSRPYCR